ncbi:uncharacterized protein LOC112588809 [Harpegnathos saltator]|uniref:uncharacterized protein LOC112588809 n=1 Tax=Harpegnathos saltator TaxID=610380 RepID=UPI000DBEED2E|nr:uncharacterized protein LOC112588809 [Harpegnathos saltator]
MTDLAKFYYDPAYYAGYSTIKNLSRAAGPGSTREEIIRWLQAQDAYILHRPARYKFPRLHYNVTNIDDLWEADLIELANLRNYNEGYCYLLTIIDVLSKFVWVEPIRSKTSDSVTEAFRRVLSRSRGRVPVWLQSDKGKEFIGQTFQKFLKEKNISFRTVRNPDVKTAVIERFNRTLKERLWRYFTHKNTHRYIDVLQSIVHAYNHTRHSTIKMEPASVTLENARIAREHMQQRYHHLDKLDRRNHRREAKYKAGTLVRVSRAKGVFEKGYEANWTEEIFRIHRILEWRNPCMYELSDLSGEVIDGIFYEQELTGVNKNLQEEEFIVDKVIRRRGQGANKEFFVSWRGYPSKFNSWIAVSNIKLLPNHDGGKPVSHDTTEQ